MKEYFVFPTRPKYKALWIGIQLLAVAPWMFAAMVTSEMVFAEPGKGYITPAGRHIACEALIHHGRSASQPACALFGSKETNPTGFCLAVASLVFLSGLMWISSRPGRGLRISK